MRLTSYLKYGISIFAIVLALTVFASASKADTMYTYTGNLLTGLTGTGGCHCDGTQITGTLILANPLPPGFTGYLFGANLPVSFTFTEGGYVFTNSNTTASDFGFITDGLGQIVAWNVDMFSGGWALYTGTGHSNVCSDPRCSVTDIRNGNGTSAFNTNNPGKWVDPPIDGVPVPEPSTIVLLAAGLIALTLRLVVRAA